MREADQIDALIGTRDSRPGWGMRMNATPSAAIVTRWAAPGATSDRTIWQKRCP